MMAGGGGKSAGGGGSAVGGSALQALSAARGRRDTPSAMAEINVTPFVDVVLVLLIIFMITAPMLVRTLDVSLPAVGIRKDQATEAVRVTVDRQGRTYMEDRAVNRDLLEQRLREAVELRGLRVAYLSADEELKYKEIMSVMEIIKRAGVDVIGMVYVYPEEKRSN
jgi:biopolymer transport protein TolR